MSLDYNEKNITLAKNLRKKGRLKAIFPYFYAAYLYFSSEGQKK